MPKQRGNALIAEYGRKNRWTSENRPRGGRPKGSTVAKAIMKRAVAELKPLILSGKYEQLVETGRTIKPTELWNATKARYRGAIESPETTIRDLTTIGRQVGEEAGALGMTRIHTTHDHYAHIPDELKPLIAEKLALLEYQRKEKECLLAQPPVPTLGAVDICVSSTSTDSKSINPEGE